jgi:hypothetical protein
MQLRNKTVEGESCCVICCESMHDKQMATIMSCGHHTHVCQDCWVNLLLHGDVRCPVCRLVPNRIDSEQFEEGYSDAAHGDFEMRCERKFKETLTKYYRDLKTGNNRLPPSVKRICNFHHKKEIKLKEQLQEKKKLKQVGQQSLSKLKAQINAINKKNKFKIKFSSLYVHAGSISHYDLARNRRRWQRRIANAYNMQSIDD